MTSTIIASGPQYTFGQMTNRATSSLIQGNTLINRLADAIETASSGYTGTPGTQFEVPSVNSGGMGGTNLFGVVADEDEAKEGQNGQAYAYAIGRLHELWGTFWAEAEAYVKQLDNGTQGM